MWNDPNYHLVLRRTITYYMLDLIIPNVDHYLMCIAPVQEMSVFIHFMDPQTGRYIPIPKGVYAASGCQFVRQDEERIIFHDDYTETLYICYGPDKIVDLGTVKQLCNPEYLPYGCEATYSYSSELIPEEEREKFT